MVSFPLTDTWMNDMSDLVRFSSTPFQEVLEYWAKTLEDIEVDMPEHITGVSATYTFELPNGMQAKIEVGRDILEEDNY